MYSYMYCTPNRPGLPLPTGRSTSAGGSSSTAGVNSHGFQWRTSPPHRTVPALSSCFLGMGNRPPLTADIGCLLWPAPIRVQPRRGALLHTIKAVSGSIAPQPLLSYVGTCDILLSHRIWVSRCGAASNSCRGLEAVVFFMSFLGIFVMLP